VLCTGDETKENRMSAAAAEPVENDGDASELAKKGRKKLIVLAAAAAVLLASAGGGAAWIVKKKHAAAAAAEAAANGDEAAPATQAAAHREVRKTPPAFLPLEAFVVNLADRETERFAQIGITLELDDAKYADQLKAYMPAIRNGILMVLAHKSSRQLLDRAGKEALANEITREAVRPLGLEFEEEEPIVEEVKAAAKGDDDDDEDEAPAPKPKNRKKSGDHNPIRHVHFSSFIIQ
jgi:flagellar FliL protein